MELKMAETITALITSDMSPRGAENYTLPLTQDQRDLILLALAIKHGIVPKTKETK